MTTIPAEEYRKLKKPKYRNVKHMLIDGDKETIFDSKKEMRRHSELILMEKRGEIRDLHMQTKFELIPAQYECKKCIEKACNYYADFTYYRNGVFTVEDVKSPASKTPQYIIKRKLMLHIYGIRIIET